MKGIPFNPNRFNPQPKAAKVEKVYKGINKVSEKTKARQDEKKLLAIELKKFCDQWYESHPTKRCFECNSRILFPTKMNFHHCIKKSDADKYNIEIALNSDVLVLVCLEDHSKAETNDTFCPKIKAHTQQLKKEFEKYLI